MTDPSSRSTQNKLSSFLLPALACVFVLGCGSGIAPERGSGTVQTDSRDLEDFEAIDISGIGQVVIRKGNNNTCTIRTDDNLIEKYETRVQDGTLFLAPNDLIQPKSGIVVTVTTSQWPRKVSVRGACRTELKDVNQSELTVVADEASKLVGAGSVQKLNVEVRKNAQVDFSELSASSVDIDAEGSANVLVDASETLKVKAIGEVVVTYQGSAEVEKTLEGRSRVIQR